jgi:hypothetical protein
MAGNGRAVEVCRTTFGRTILTKAEDYLPSIADNSVHMVVTSPLALAPNSAHEAVHERPESVLSAERPPFWT